MEGLHPNPRIQKSELVDAFKKKALIGSSWKKLGGIGNKLGKKNSSKKFQGIGLNPGKWNN